MINDNQSTQPFSDLDINSAADVTITITFPEANGILSPTTASFTHSGDVYTLALTDTASAVAFLNDLTFTPQPNRLAVGLVESTVFQIVADDGANSDTNTQFLVFSKSMGKV